MKQGLLPLIDEQRRRRMKGVEDDQPLLDLVRLEQISHALCQVHELESILRRHRKRFVPDYHALPPLSCELATPMSAASRRDVTLLRPEHALPDIGTSRCCSRHPRPSLAVTPLPVRVEIGPLLQRLL